MGEQFFVELLYRIRGTYAGAADHTYLGKTSFVQSVPDGANPRSTGPYSSKVTPFTKEELPDVLSFSDKAGERIESRLYKDGGENPSQWVYKDKDGRVVARVVS